MPLPRLGSFSRSPLDVAFEGIRTSPLSVAAWAALADVLQEATRLPESLAASERALALLADFGTTTTPEGSPSEEEVRRRRAFLAVTLGKERVESILQNPRSLEEVICSLHREAVCRFLDRELRAKPPADRANAVAQKRADDKRTQALATLLKDPRQALFLGLEAFRLYPSTGYEFFLFMAKRLVDAGRTPEAVGLLHGLVQVTHDRTVLVHLLRHCREPDLPANVLATRQEALQELSALYPSDPELVAERALEAAQRGCPEEAMRLRDWLLSHPDGFETGEELDSLLFSLLHASRENYRRSALALREAGRRGVATEQALRWYRDALEVNAFEMRALAAIVDSYLAAAAHENAVYTAMDAFHRLPDSVAASSILYRALSETCREREALRVALYQLGRWPSRKTWSRVAEASHHAGLVEWAQAAATMAQGHTVAPSPGSDDVAEEIHRQARSTRACDLVGQTGD